MKRKWLVALLIYVALILLCVTVIYAIPSVKGLLEKTYIAEYGSLDIVDDVSGYIVRDEEVYVAGQDSEVEQLIESGQLIKAKTRIVRLTPVEKSSGLFGFGAEEDETADAQDTAADTEKDSKEKAEKKTDKKSDNKSEKKNGKKSKKKSDKKSGKDTTDKDKKSDEDTEKKADKDNASAAAEQQEDDEAKSSRKFNSVLEELGDSVRTTTKGKCKSAGFVTYYVDGSETALNTALIWDLREKDLKELCNKKQIDTTTKKCNTGDPLFKIVKNSKWYYVTFMNTKDAEKYYDGRPVTLTVGEESFPAKVAYSESSKRKTKVVYSCKAFFDGFLEMRKMDAVVTAASAEGLVIQDSSIIEKDGQKGVLIKNKLGERKFRPISIKADDGEKCVVYSDIYVDEEGNFVETLANYDEVVAEPTEEDIKNLNAKK